MKREFLKELEIEDALIDKIMAENGKDIEKFKANESTKDTSIADLKKQLSDANEQIEGFKGLDVEAIQKAADNWKIKAETAETEATKKIKQMQFDYALDNALTGAKAKNAKAVKALLDMDKLLPNDDGKIVGLDEQLTELQKDNAYLFDIKQADEGKPSYNYNPAGGNGKPDFSQMTDEDYYAYQKQQQQTQ